MSAQAKAAPSVSFQDNALTSDHTYDGPGRLWRRLRRVNFNPAMAGLAQTDLEYEVTRVKSPVLGRDLNPMGRGDGAYYADGGNVASGGSLTVRAAKPRLSSLVACGVGNSINNRTPGIPPPKEWPKTCCCELIGCIKCPAVKSDGDEELLAERDPSQMADLERCCIFLKETHTPDDCPKESGWGYYTSDWNDYCSEKWAHPEQERWGEYPDRIPDPVGNLCGPHQVRGIRDAVWHAKDCVSKVGAKILGKALADCVIWHLIRILAGDFRCQKPGEEACCIGISGNTACCKPSDVALACQYPRPLFGRRTGYILFCSKFFDEKYYSYYTSRYCFKVQTVLHEALHLCGVRHKAGKPTVNDRYADAILCHCRCNCFEVEKRREVCKVIRPEEPL